MASRTRARINNLNDRAREVGAAGVLTLEDIDALKAFYDFTCLKCGKRPAISPDHVKPLAAGGANTVENLQLLCETCNKGKGDEEIDYRCGKVLTPDLVPQFAKSTEPPTKTNYKKHDWDAIRFEYVTTTKTLEDLSEQFGAHISQVYARSAAEHWTAQREKFSRKLVGDIQQEAGQIAKAEGVSAVLETARVLRAAIDRWEFDGNKAKLGEIVDGLKLLAAMQGETTERHNVNVSEQPDDAAILARINSVFDAGEEERTYAPAESLGDESGAGWTD